jgi:stearoyl-CoA desaturase (delta-9 desaturase)
MLNHVLDWAAHGLLHASLWAIVLGTLAATHWTIIAVTVFLHRAQAHRALALHPIAAHAFRFWLWLSTGMVTREWVAIHRKHHARCETADDPHSPVAKGLWQVLLRGSELYRAEAENASTLQRYGAGTPDDWVERHVYARLRWQGVGLMLLIDLLLFGAAGATVWAVQMAWIPVLAAGVVNGLGHALGYRNYATRDASHNLLPWGLLIGGEELHNNHHTHPSAARLALKWWEFDLGWVYIRMLVWCGLASRVRLPPRTRIGPPCAQVDLAQLQRVIANRYDLMARYATELRRLLRAEARSVQPERRALLQAVRRFVARDRDTLDGKSCALLDAAARGNPRLEQLLQMREELRAVWLQSAASAEQLREQLQDWCQRAKDSGVGALQTLELRLRSYA